MTTTNGIFQPTLAAKPHTALQTLSMPELYDTTFHQPPPIIKDWLYPGLTLLAGSPKIGKSFFVLQLAYHVAKGKALFDYQTNKCSVLYLALEDQFYRLQKRLNKMFDVDVAPDLHFAVAASTLENGLDEQIADFIAAYPDVKLIIIDTMQKIRSKTEEQLSYGRDYNIGTRLKELADKHHIALLVVHHTRKQRADDIFEKISGTNGLLGSVDGAMILEKEDRSSSTATLDISGRDQSDQKLTLKFNRTNCRWELIKAKAARNEEPYNPLLAAIAKFITPERPYWRGTATELAAELAALDCNIAYNYVTQKLNAYVNELQYDYGIYFHNNHTRLKREIMLQLIDKPKAA